MKIYKKSIMTCALLSVAGAANCGISENSWLFMPMEKATYDFTSGSIKTGIEAGCESFTPSNASFAITYSGTPEAEKYFRVETDETAIVTHDKLTKTVRVTNPQRLYISLPFGGKYTIKNSSSVTVEGTECDAGII